jgi:hypothetical protein
MLRSFAGSFRNKVIMNVQEVLQEFDENIMIEYDRDRKGGARNRTIQQRWSGIL